MVVTAGRNSSSLQTFGNTYEPMFEADAATGGPASVFKVHNIANGMIVRVNGDDDNEVTIAPGDKEILESVQPGGIQKVEGKNLTTDSNATAYWSANIAI